MPENRTQPGEPVALRPARFKDYEGITAVARRNGLFLSKSFEDWKSVWTANPANPAIRDEPWTIGWVLESNTGHIAGHLGNIPMEYELRGRRILAAAAHAWAVDKEFRRNPGNQSNSILLMNRFFAQNSELLLLCNTSNINTGRAFTSHGGARIPALDYERPMFQITGFAGFGQSVLRSKNLPAAKALGALAGPALWAAQSVRARAAHFKIPARLRLETLSAFDDRFDAFWEQLRTQSRKLLLVRNRAALAWHYDYALSRDRAWLVTCEHGSTLAGYAIFLNNENRDTGLKRLWLADIQALGNDTETVMLSLVSAGLKHSRNRGFHILESVGFDQDKRRVLRKLLPWSRQQAVFPFYYRAPETSDARLLAVPECWDPCIADGDAGL
jgi:hypothetical protein